MYSLWHRKGKWFSLLCCQKENNWDKTLYLLHEKYYFHFAPQKALDQAKTSWDLCGSESFGWASFGFCRSHITFRGLLLIYIWQSVIWVQFTVTLCRTKFEKEETAMCWENGIFFTRAALSKHTSGHYRLTYSIFIKFLFFFTFYLINSTMNGHNHLCGSVSCLYTDTWPVRWHIEWIQMGFFTINQALQLSTFFWEKKNNIENNTTYNQIHFFRSSSFSYAEGKASAVFTFIREQNSTGDPLQKASSSSQIWSHPFKARAAQKADESRSVEAGARHEHLMTFSLKTNLPYRQNNHCQHHHWYTEVSCALTRFAPSSTLRHSFTKHQ